MRYILLIIGKLINRIFAYSYQDHRYFKSWKYIYGISLQGMGRLQGNPIEESGEVDVIKKVLSEPGDGAVIFDVGGNKGQYSSHVMANVKAGKKINLHIFEPSAINIPILQEKFNVSKYPGHQLVINQLALSDDNSQHYLYSDEKGSDIGSLLNLKISPRPFDDKEKEMVETITLDNYIQRAALRSIDLLKLDVEGAEYKIFIGASHSIEAGLIKNIQFEFGAANVDSRNFFFDFWNLLSSKYDFFQVMRGGLIPITEYSTDLEIFKTTNYFLVLK